jgi:oligopeptide/dipeptide ABC transporter ATP-binding protein
MTQETAPPIIEARSVRRHFSVRGSNPFGPPRATVRAVDGVSFSIAEGETLGLVGESGCGKTTVSRLVLDVDHPTDGEISFRGTPIAHLNKQERQSFRSSVQAVFQDPQSSLNPRMRVGDIIAEPITAKERIKRSILQSRVADLLAEVGLPAAAVRLYPHQFSGGQRQRIAIARALAPNPDLLTLDEPVSALDVSIRAQIINLLKQIQRSRQIAFLLIAHHLATVRFLSHRIAVMYLGKIVEEGTSTQVFRRPLHPYTQGLMSASLVATVDRSRPEIVLLGEVPSPANPPSGCSFHPRCPFAMEICTDVVPEWRTVEEGHRVTCHLY